MVTFSPATRPFFSRMVNVSSSAWVGCSCAPSPAFTTLPRMNRDRKCGAPLALWRMMMMSAASASRLRAVSLSVSPFFSDEASAVKLITSAVRRSAASSKLMRVRVEGSIKRLTTVLPRKAGTFLIARSPTALNALAVSLTSVISSAESDSMSSRCLRFQAFIGEGGSGVMERGNGVMECWSVGSRAALASAQYSSTPLLQFSSCPFEIHHVLAVLLFQSHVHAIRRRARDVLADEVRLDGQLAVAAVDEHGQLHPARTAKVVQRVERGAGGPAAEQHVVHHHDRPAFQIKRQERRLDVRRGLAVEIVPMHAHVDVANGHRMAPDALEQGAQSFGQVNAPALDPDDRHGVGRLVALGNFVGDPREYAVDGLGVEEDGPVRHKKNRAGPWPVRFRSNCFDPSIPWRPRRTALKEPAAQLCAWPLRESSCRCLRHRARWLMIQSVKARSKPMSWPAFSDSIHLCFMISSRSA